MLPIEFKERMKSLLGGESELLFEEIENGVEARSFRINKIKAQVDICEKLEFGINGTRAAFPKGAFYTEEEHPGSLPCHHAGMIYMQDPSAMATVHAVKISKGALILDSCSAPGGKTTQLADMTGEEGIVVANEYEAKRCRILLGNVERMGCRNTTVLNLDTAVLAEVYPEKFDVVLCDAPCSGEGMFRKNSRAIDEWSVDNVKMCAERQREILANVAKCVAAGGSQNKEEMKELPASRVLLVIALSIYHGFQSTGVDNVAHIGGALGGILLANMLYRKIKEKKKLF